jgi:hypothetical protein
MGVEGPPRPIRLAVRVDAQHDPRDLAPVGPFRRKAEGTYVKGERKGGSAGAVKRKERR